MTPTEPDDTTLLAEMLKLRASLQVARRRELLFRLFVLAVILAGFLLYRGIIDARNESRAGLCFVINDMRTKHNHFVQTSIDERQAIIDETMNPASVDFFEQQIANYQVDLLPEIDCHDPDALASLFKKPEG